MFQVAKAPNCTKKPKCVVCGKAHSPKNFPNKRKGNQNVLIVRDLMSPTLKAVLLTRMKPSGSMWSKNKFHTSNICNFTAKQIVSLVTNVVIQVALPQLCTKNLPENKCRPYQICQGRSLKQQRNVYGSVSKAKKCLSQSFRGKLPLPQRPLCSMLIEKKKAPLKASAVLNPSSCTKSTKTPSLGLHWKSSSKLSQPQSNLMRFSSKFENVQNFLIFFHSSRKHILIMFTIEFDHFESLSYLYSQGRRTESIFKVSAKARVYDFGQNLKRIKTS